MRFKPRRLEEPEINLISLIDVVLMMVVFFMLTSTFTEEGRLKIRLPAADSVPIVKPAIEPLVITVTAGGAYLVNGRELVNSSSDTLRAAIARQAGEQRSGTVTIRADGRATHQAVVTAMDVIGKLGFRQLNIATTDSAGAAAQ
ncbi:MAG TPA: biopolymer transporter ExbD [Steroidobacteraceae bacterium]|nr:biopolymer transporter ExbD [Steroidobacteraceae bacterium]